MDDSFVVLPTKGSKRGGKKIDDSFVMLPGTAQDGRKRFLFLFAHVEIAFLTPGLL